MCIQSDPVKSSSAEGGLHFIDEPTNDLDTQTLAILEDYLDHYDGIVITVSHDRYFLDRIANRMFAFEGNGVIRQYEGGYTDYVNRRREEGLEDSNSFEKAAVAPKTAEDKPNAKAAWKQGTKKLKFSYKEQREYENIEDDIAQLEQKLEELDTQMSENATNAVKLRELLEEKEQAEQLLEEKMERWEYLEELAAKIAKQ